MLKLYLSDWLYLRIRALWSQQRLIETIFERNVSLQEAKMLELTLDTYQIATGGPKDPAFKAGIEDSLKSNYANSLILDF